jgi:hypothetical protein
MSQSHNPPIDPDTVAEIAPGEGPEPGSVEYGGSEIHREGAGSGARAPAGGEAVTTEAGTFQDLPVGEDDQGE